LKDGQDSLALITLDLDSFLANHTTGSAGRLQLAQNGTQVRCNRVEAGDDGDGLAPATLLASNAGGLVRWEHDLVVCVAWACALIQRPFANVAGDRAFQRCSIEQP
jgi:hypothetical protein